MYDKKYILIRKGSKQYLYFYQVNPSKKIDQLEGIESALMMITLTENHSLHTIAHTLVQEHMSFAYVQINK